MKRAAKMYLRTIAILCLLLVFSANGVETKANEEGVKDTAVTAGKVAVVGAAAAMNPAAVAFMAATAVVKAGVQAFVQIKETAEWEKKENEAVCALAIQTYQHTGLPEVPVAMLF